MWSQVGLKKHYYEQSYRRWWNSCWAMSNPKRWCCESAALNCQQIWKTQQWPQDWKRSVFIPIPKKGNAKKCSNYYAVALHSHAIKVMLKILQAWHQLYMNWELPDVQAGFRKGRETIKLPTFNGSYRKQENSRKKKNIYFCFIDYAKAFDCMDHN